MANISAALAEDMGSGDLTANLIPAGKKAEAIVICRESAIICGRPWFDAIFSALDPHVSIDWQINEGDEAAANRIICHLFGSARMILSGERAALNFLQTLSGTATIVNRYAKRLTGTHTRLLDTRKTLPGLRIAQKYAVRCGGGQNHRIGLFDAVLIKENHIISAGGIRAAVETARQLAPGIHIEVETENLKEVEEALQAGANIIMLDEFSHEDAKKAVDRVAGCAQTEISGNVDEHDLSELAKLGVDFISVGALTKHVQAIDLSMRITI